MRYGRVWILARAALAPDDRGPRFIVRRPWQRVRLGLHELLACGRRARSVIMPGKPAFSLVIPLFNEEENLSPLIEELGTVLTALDRPFEVVLVDDGSTDRSLEIAKELAAEDPRLRVVHLHRRSGQSAALVAGFRSVRGDVIVTLDADLQNDPADIPRLLAELDSGWDVVCGIRQDRRDPWTRRVASRIANAVRNRLTHDAVTDVGCSLRAMRSPFLAHLPEFAGMHRFLPTLLKMAGARITEIPVSHRPRRHGKGKYGINNRLWRGIADLMAVRWLQKRWIGALPSEEVTAVKGRENPASGTDLPA